ncbi:hypothetical protein LR68_03310 [Anoxybacillus sp. BCO1]|nr:hypothetical protein LR68_03310 [Anoxybacillus sp. BCO1]
MEQIKKVYVRVVEKILEGDWLVTVGVSLFKMMAIILVASILLKVVKLTIAKFFCRSAKSTAPII